MENNSFTRFQCWQNERIIQVINKEAVSIDKSNFLATHAPLNSIKYEQAPREINDKTEEGLLRELQIYAEQNRHAFMVVQGIPGTGKSHLIRWLKEKYEAANKEQHGTDIVLLIERAHCNLRGTLLQIIESGVFDNTALHNQLQRLHDATSKLKSETLADTILDQLRNATSEVELPEEQLPSRYIRKRVRHFLQDFYVRQALTQKGGPVDRIIKYLTDDKGGLEKREIPGFGPQDFEFTPDIRRHIRDGGYEETRQLAVKLCTPEEPEHRQEVAIYFNRLLNYAVGRTTALSPEDLKQIFNELRRQLRLQGHQLVLFIEDITAFTGIDEGLIDVLATQHTGEGNREFCRLLSIIGITDNYFTQHFPDNMKDRVTHRLTLNKQERGVEESDLLRSSLAVNDLSARYLNAIRLSQEELEDWVTHGAYPEQLPNACDRCRYKSTCHAAFGAVNLQTGQDASPQQVGLYPFNEIALWTMYQQLASTNTSRTPRSLLNSVLGYVLISHGSRIQTGEFPPLAHKLGSDFKAPSLQKIAHREMLLRQAGPDAQRVEALILFWGSRSIASTIRDEKRYVGNLPEEVFRAFQLPFIEGEPSQTVVNTPSPLPLPIDNYGSGKSALVKEKHIEPFSPPASREDSGRYTADINNWLNGEKLQNFEKLRQLLASFIETAVNWDLYGITVLQVKDRIKPARFAIEGQTGITSNDILIFKRSPRLATLLQALDYLNTNSKTFTPDKLGGYLTDLSRWLADHEEMIVNFVRRPTAQSTETRPQAEITLINCLLLACLQGKLAHKDYSSQELLLLLINESAKSNEKQWLNAIAEAEQIHSSKWKRLMEGVNSRNNNYVNTCRLNLLQVLNRPQGLSKTARFIDTDLALQILEKFEQDDWKLLPMEAPGGSASREWIAACEIYRAFATNLQDILYEDRMILTEITKKLQQFVGNNTPKEVFQHINNWVQTMEQLQKPRQFTLRTELSATGLARTLAALEDIGKEQRLRPLALKLSGATSTIRDAREYLSYLQSFVNEVSKQLSQLQESHNNLLAESGNTIPPERVQRAYQEIVDVVTNMISYREEVLS